MPAAVAAPGARDRRRALHNGENLSRADTDIPILRADIGETLLSEASKTTRRGMKDVVTQVFRAGAPGIVLSCDFTEMKLENLRGAGDAIRALGLKVCVEARAESSHPCFRFFVTFPGGFLPRHSGGFSRRRSSSR